MEKLTVCIPVYNNCDTVNQTVCSVLNNSEKPDEIILGDPRYLGAAF